MRTDADADERERLERFLEWRRASARRMRRARSRKHGPAGRGRLVHVLGGAVLGVFGVSLVALLTADREPGAAPRPAAPPAAVQAPTGSGVAGGPVGAPADPGVVAGLAAPVGTAAPPPSDEADAPTSTPRALEPAPREAPEPVTAARTRAIVELPPRTPLPTLPERRGRGQQAAPPTLPPPPSLSAPPELAMPPAPAAGGSRVERMLDSSAAAAAPPAVEASVPAPGPAPPVSPEPATSAARSPGPPVPRAARVAPAPVPAPPPVSAPPTSAAPPQPSAMPASPPVVPEKPLPEPLESLRKLVDDFQDTPFARTVERWIRSQQRAAPGSAPVEPRHRESR
jgi:hypothetical protein